VEVIVEPALAIPIQMSPLVGYRSELSAYREELCSLPDQEPGLAFQRLAGISARLAEMRAQLWRVNNRQADALRTREVDPLIDTLEFIFKSLSRAQAVRQFDYDLSRGGT
jgi:hypothetical protein